MRLSHPEFIKWFNLIDNKKRIINFALANPSYNLNTWAKKNAFILDRRYNEYKEIYLPRLIYSFYLKDKILHFLQLKKRMNISLNFFKGEVKQIKNEKTYNILPSKLFNGFNISFNKKKDFIIKGNKSNNLKLIKSKKLIIGTGIVPLK